MALSGAERQKRYRQRLKARGGSPRPLVEDFCRALAGPSGEFVFDGKSRTVEEEAALCLDEITSDCRRSIEIYEEFARVRRGDTADLSPDLVKAAQALSDRLDALVT